MFVYPGDISYLVVNDVDAKPAKSDEILGTVQTTTIHWVEPRLSSPTPSRLTRNRTSEENDGRRE